MRRLVCSRFLTAAPVVARYPRPVWQILALCVFLFSSKVTCRPTVHVGMYVMAMAPLLNVRKKEGKGGKRTEKDGKGGKKCALLPEHSSKARTHAHSINVSATVAAAGAAAILRYHYFRSVPHAQQQRHDAGRRWWWRATPLHRYDGQPLRRSPGSGRPPSSAVAGGYVPSASGFGSDSCSAPASGSPPPIRCRVGAPVYRAAAHAAASGPAPLGGRVQL